VGIMVQVRPGGNDPINEPLFHQGNQAGHAQTRRRQCSRQTDSDGNVISQHFFGVQMAGLSQACCIVGFKGGVNELGEGRVWADGTGIDLLA